MSKGRSVYNVTTNASGNVGMYIFPNQPIVNVPDAYMAGCFIATYNDSTFDPATGASLADPTY